MIRRRTSFKLTQQLNPKLTTPQIRREISKADYPGGVRLTAKMLRDYFATNVSAETSDKTLKALMRHGNVSTTSRYLRTVPERMTAAVANLGPVDDAHPISDDAQSDAPSIPGFIPWDKLVKEFENQLGKEWRWTDSNCRRRGYEPRALTN